MRKKGRKKEKPEFDIDLSKAKIVPREKMRFAKPGEADPRNCKVRITIYLDADVLQYFKAQAEKPYAPAYQTQINQALRQFIEQSGGAKSYEQLLTDDHFIQAVAQRVHAIEKH